MFAGEQAGVWADIVCLGKGMSGGYLPISATVVKASIYETFKDLPEDHTLYHGHTFTGNPIAAALAVETLRVYDDEHVVARAAAGGAVLAAELASFVGLSGVRNVRSLGMIGVVELEAGAQDEGTQRAARVRDRLRTAGILLRPLGPVIYVMPPLTTPEPVLHDLMRAVRDALQTA